MWIEFKQEHSLSAARRWKDLIEEEGIPVRLLPPIGPEQGVYKVLVPGDKEHLIPAIIALQNTR
jgi:hypothetical protein